MSEGNTFRGGRVHVVDGKCSTCVFRPGNLMNLRAGRLKDLVDDALAADTGVICHSTLGTDANAICGGFAEAYSTNPLRMAGRMGLIEYDPPLTLESGQR